MNHRPNVRLISLALGAAALVMVPLGATAQEEESMQCGERGSILEVLNSEYDETARAIGLVSEDAVLEVFVSKDSGTWTVLVTDPEGFSCVLAAGEDWQEMPLATDQAEPNGDGGNEASVKLSLSPQ